jgi:hypothetical protein
VPLMTDDELGYWHRMMRRPWRRPMRRAGDCSSCPRPIDPRVLAAREIMRRAEADYTLGKTRAEQGGCP